jgi:hypothetical protein
MASETPRAQGAGAPPKKSSFFGRWLRRLIVLAVLGAAALVGGFKYEKGAWAWDDPNGFQLYALAKWDVAKAKATEYARYAKQKADESGLTAKTEELIERARRALATEEPAPESKTVSLPANGGAAPAPAPAGTDAGKADAKSVEAKSEVPAGYMEEYKAGLEAYRAGLVHFKDSMPHTPKEQAELLAAKAKFEEARDHWQKAASLYDKDTRLDEMMVNLNQYLMDCRKRLKPATY